MHSSSSDDIDELHLTLRARVMLRCLSLSRLSTASTDTTSCEGFGGNIQALAAFFGYGDREETFGGGRAD